ITVKRLKRPFDHTRDMTMLDRIPIDVIRVSIEIHLITNLVLPKLSLPNGTFSMFCFRRVHPFFPMK
ncbi:MAG: hypothetical protein V3V31_08680, partial [Methylococcales bacterium]